MQFIDLRSDTVTKPDFEMKQAMSIAEVGDDVFRDDPTVIKLEDMVGRGLKNLWILCPRVILTKWNAKQSGCAINPLRKRR